MLWKHDKIRIFLGNEGKKIISIRRDLMSRLNNTGKHTKKYNDQRLAISIQNDE